MHFGKSLKLATLLEYKDNSLQLVKYSILEKKKRPLFDNAVYPILDLENVRIQEAYNEARKLNMKKFYVFSTTNYDLKINPYFLYTDKMILKKMKDSNLEFGEVIKKQKVK